MGRTMGVRRLVSLFLTVLLAACGGSGSSGFDVTPGGLEAPLIERAIAENRCVEGDGLVICPSGVAAPDGGMNTPDLSGPGVEADFAFAVECNPGELCTLSLDLTTASLPPGAEVRVAVRPTDGDVWHVGEPIGIAPTTDGGSTVTPVTVELPGVTRPDGEVQVAVLVFVPPLGAVPSEVQELRETGASYAFVVAPFSLIPGASF